MNLFFIFTYKYIYLIQNKNLIRTDYIIYIYINGGKNMANAILAAILSLILPGLGQIYGGQGLMKGIGFIIIALILNIISASTYSVIWLISIIFTLYAIYDAYVNVH